MNIKDIINLLLKRWKLLSIALLIPFILSIIFSFFIAKPVYGAEASVIVGPQISKIPNPYTYSDLLMYEHMVKSYKEVLKSRLVVQNTIDKLSLKDTVESIKKNITINTIEGTEILKIYYTNNNPDYTATIVNGLIDSLKEVTASIKGADNIIILDRAVYPEKPISPNKSLNVLVGLLLGIGLALIILFLVEYKAPTKEYENPLDISANE